MLPSIASVGIRDDLAGGHFQGGEQVGDAVPLVVLRAPLSPARPQRKHRGGLERTGFELDESPYRLIEIPLVAITDTACRWWPGRAASLRLLMVAGA